jgi:hypothetical protein
MSSKPFQLAVAMLATVPAFGQSLTLESYWSVAPVNATTFPDTGNLTRGGGFNPVSGNLLVATRAGGTGVRILDGATGALKGNLNVTGISGGTFALNMVSVAADGAIYGANLVTDAATSPFRVYRWANESAEPTLVYSGNPGAGRFGDSFAVRGSGASTEIIAGQGGTGVTTATRLFHLGTADGSTFTPSTFNVSGITGGDLRLGLDFGEGNTVYAKQGGALRYVSYDVSTLTATLTSSFTLGTGGGTSGPLAYSDGLLVAYAYAAGPAPGPNSVNLYDVASLVTSGANTPLDAELLATTNANSNGVGGVDFNADGSIVYIIAPNNGVHAYRVVPEPGTWALLGAGTVLLGWTLRRRS